MVFIHRLSEIGWDRMFNLFVRTDYTSVKFSPKVIKRQGRIGAAITCTSDMLIGIWFCFLVNHGRFNLSHADEHERVYHHRGQRFANACIIEQDCFRGGWGSALVWSGIMGGNKTCLIVTNGNINTQIYINDVLTAEAFSFIQFHGPSITFMHDKACPHSAAITRQFLATNNVNVLDWPANSPDL